ncbi:MAG TPA: HAD family hydrolase [Acidimicrobiales bacterium]|nr:HAD family hydrolase [Acidimicrobiales bacterium]
MSTSAPRSGSPAVLFDIDGTLVDTNFLHALAWRRAFLDAGLDVPTAWVHRRIGMGASTLIQELVGHDRPDVKDNWRRHFERLKPEVRALPGAADLLRAVASRGVKVVLASSSEEEDLEALLQAIAADDVVDCVTSAGDVEEAKPSPEVFTTALAKAGCGPERALVLGDTVWDVKAAGAAGLACVGVLTGGVSAAELADAGAVAVYDDARALVAALDDSPLARLFEPAAGPAG